MFPACIIAATFAATLAIVSLLHLIGRVRHYRRSHYLADQRLRLLRQLLKHAYQYGSNPALFLKKFQEEVSIGHLESYDVICTYGEQRQIASRKHCGQSLKNHDLLLCILHDKGFTPQELSVVFGMKNCNSIYVRYSRIRKQHEMSNNNTQTDENRKNSCR